MNVILWDIDEKRKLLQKEIDKNDRIRIGAETAIQAVEDEKRKVKDIETANKITAEGFREITRKQDEREAFLDSWEKANKKEEEKIAREKELIKKAREVK